MKVMHRFLLHNEKICDTSEVLLMPGQTGLLNGWGVFSTMRVFDGILFSYERHWARMQRDAKLLRVPMPAEPKQLENQLMALVEANHARNATLRVAVVRNRGGAFEGPAITRDYDVIAFTADVKKWGNGVKLGVVPQARHAASPFAGTKMLSWSFNLCWYEAAHQRGLDEVVLLNERDEVSECTSANIFAAKDNEVWTPPLSSGCLPGITRELLLGEIHVPNYKVIEKTLRLEDLAAADEVFITSTTRELLPVVSIEGTSVNRNEGARLALQTAFSQYVDDYVAKRSLSV
jgi:branched-chain amino acid aminotransferase